MSLEIWKSDISAHVSACLPWSVWTPAIEDTTIAAVEWEPLRNSCSIASEFGLLQAFVYNLLYNNKPHPYYSLQNQHQLPEAVLFGCSYANGCISNTLLMHSIKIFFGPIKHVLHMSESLTSTLITFGHGLILILPAHLAIKSVLA